mmetsp:Transcript_5177/g.14853  ORF Transcript_5177/g.14853 Transcript_5177/m.14853 type:complete len:457 (+) Transcript_5177:112-1482(+)
MAPVDGARGPRCFTTTCAGMRQLLLRGLPCRPRDGKAESRAGERPTLLMGRDGPARPKAESGKADPAPCAEKREAPGRRTPESTASDSAPPTRLPTRHSRSEVSRRAPTRTSHQRRRHGSEVSRSSSPLPMRHPLSRGTSVDSFLSEAMELRGAGRRRHAALSHNASDAQLQAWLEAGGAQAREPQPPLSQSVCSALGGAAAEASLLAARWALRGAATVGREAVSRSADASAYLGAKGWEAAMASWPVVIDAADGARQLALKASGAAAQGTQEALLHSLLKFRGCMLERLEEGEESPCASREASPCEAPRAAAQLAGSLAAPVEGADFPEGASQSFASEAGLRSGVALRRAPVPSQWRWEHPQRTVVLRQARPQGRPAQRASVARARDQRQQLAAPQHPGQRRELRPLPQEHQHGPTAQQQLQNSLAPRAGARAQGSIAPVLQPSATFVALNPRCR